MTSASNTPKRPRRGFLARYFRAPEGREGMVEVYGSVSGEYLGCMGIETWRNYLAEEATRRLLSVGRCDVERDIHFHGSGDHCECGARPNTAWAGSTPFSEGEARP